MRGPRRSSRRSPRVPTPPSEIVSSSSDALRTRPQSQTRSRRSVAIGSSRPAVGCRRSLRTRCRPMSAMMSTCSLKSGCTSCHLTGSGAAVGNDKHESVTHASAHHGATWKSLGAAVGNDKHESTSASHLVAVQRRNAVHHQQHKGSASTVETDQKRAKRKLLERGEPFRTVVTLYEDRRPRP